MDYEKCEMTPVNRYEHWEILERRRNYNLQNSLVSEYNYPDYYYKDKNNWNNGDFVGSTYTDCLDDDQRAKIKGIPYNSQKCSNEDLIRLGNLIFDRKDITGVRVVEFTNVSTGYPLWRIDAFAKASDTPKPEKKEVFEDDYWSHGPGGFYE
jgi:hypothetical protein